MVNEIIRCEISGKSSKVFVSVAAHSLIGIVRNANSLSTAKEFTAGFDVI